MAEKDIIRQAAQNNTEGFFGFDLKGFWRWDYER